jgi:GT2 family glycosyltransferase
MSCDKYRCLAPAFEACMDRYYPSHPKIHPIFGNEIWSKRLREGLEYLIDDYVLFMLDDMLLRQPVNEELIEDAIQVLENNPKVAVVNFEKNYREALPFSDN